MGVKIEFFTREEVCWIDVGLPLTGSSQETGFYWWEEEIGPEGMVGPFDSTAEAAADAALVLSRLIRNHE